MDRRNKQNRERLAQILRDLPVALAYVYERDRTIDDIRAEFGLGKFGELEVLKRLGLTTDRRQTKRVSDAEP